MEKNYINFYREVNKNTFNDFRKNKKICNHEFEEQEEYKYNIFYWIRMIFNPIGGDDLLLGSHEFDIDDFLWNEVYSNTEIDFIWTNTKADEPNISFVKFFKKDLSETDYSEYNKNINEMIEEVYKLREEFEKYNKKTNQNTKIEQIDKIERILQNISDQYEDMKKPDDSWNIKNIKFNIYFYFPASGNKSANQDDKKEISKKIEAFIKKQKKNSSIQFQEENIIIEDELTNIYDESVSNVLLVPKGEIEIDKEENWLQYSNEDKKIESYICNVSAKSIKNLWKEYENKLLGMNLRLHIKNKNVDEEIKKSIEDNDGLFWFKNNGLVIICSDIKFLKNKIELKNFSIINGGQTTFSIGNSNFDKDFFLTCKIIVIKGLQDEDGVDEKEYEKIHEISTTISLSTNNQKPIKKTDKISSISNCRILKQDLWKEKEEVFLEIRRGDKPFKKIKAWQKIKAETLQQIYYAFFKLLPGKARIKQDSLFKVENLKSSFEDMRKMSFSLIIDLIKFWFILNENSKNKNFSKITIEHIQNETELKLYQKQFVTYFKFYSISALFILVLMYKNENFKIWIKDKKSYFQEEYVQPKEKRKKDWIFEILDYWNKTNIERIFKFKDLEKIKSKWNGFIHKNMNIIFFKNIKDKEGNEILSWTNFTKTDINFLPILINIIDNYDVIEDELGSLF